MSNDLFGGALVERRRSPQRKLLTVASIVLHTLALAGIVVMQVFAMGPLPLPRRPLMFEEIRTVTIAAIAIPPAARRSDRSGAARITPSPVPIEEPPGVTNETGLENLGRAAAVAIAGVEGGLEGVAAIGPTEKAAPPPTAPSAPASQAPVRLRSGIVPPRKIVDVTPGYPSLAQAAHVKGIVIVEAVIDARGRVTSVQVLRSVPLLDQAAIDAVRQWQYTPALLNDRPVPVIVTVTINFSM
jgi:periplasmic protein TonB